MSVRITCINKDNGNHDNPHEAISHYGWVEDGSAKTGKSSRVALVEWIGNKNFAYVTDSDGNKVKCYVNISQKGNKFLQTYSDGRYTNNLLSLPECK